MRRRRGFTLIEAAFTLAVIAIILAAAVPSYASYIARQRLRHVAELLEMDLRRARTSSVDERRNIHVTFNSGPQWCWGVSRQAPCDCATGLPRCELGSVSFRDHKGTLLQSGQAITFEAGLGRAMGWTRIGLSNDHNQQLHIDLNPLGRPAICGADARKGSC
ncbi:pilus assembly FimT family protein [Roseateles cellulosilyticus]|uniref:Prepilin-type N-terminal cleavage/methylation domain-containing protein n=1 Tax=Pelomonas cellulosilytica TaxID=2906762 RepID=A0ABS8XSZ5_9BURK|nr:prepilin-type N-terminal cleavage/methylation domain-containing protein [Pelomonas sp. P8]MCE4554855.1 prepilin-type N-terminal cleavage/methylation domain-containing protein [Pelomonas sp. P8]